MGTWQLAGKEIDDEGDEGNTWAGLKTGQLFGAEIVGYIAEGPTPGYDAGDEGNEGNDCAGLEAGQLFGAEIVGYIAEGPTPGYDDGAYAGSMQS